MALDIATNHVTLPLGLYKLVLNGRPYIGSIQRGYVAIPTTRRVYTPSIFMCYITHPRASGDPTNILENSFGCLMNF